MTASGRPGRLAAAGLGLVVFGSGFVAAAAWTGAYGFATGFACLTAVGVLALARRSPGGVEPATVAGSRRRDGSADLIAATPQPVVALDARLVVTDANEPARAIIPGLQQGQPLAFALRAPEILDAARSALATGEPTIAEYGGRGSGSVVYEVRVRPVGDGRGGPGVALFFRDLTAERRLQVMRSDFVATVSHELRTPLASLSGFIDTLRGPARDDVAAQERFLGVMRVQADRMTRLVDDLLQLSRVEMHTHVAPSTRVELRMLVGHMIEILTPLARERGVAIGQDLGTEALDIPGDRDELLRLVENLVENAVKYGGSGGRVEVALRAIDGPAVDLTVRDFGPGIAPEHLPRLTERFYRVDTVESRSQGGTGLGLAIVKHIVGRHRGRLAIESEPGEGVLVRVTLPASLPLERDGG